MARDHAAWLWPVAAFVIVQVHAARGLANPPKVDASSFAERVAALRADRAASSSPEALSSLGQEAATLADPVERIDALLFAAEGLSERAGKPAEGRHFAERVLSEAEATPVDRGRAAVVVIRSLSADGEDEAAIGRAFEHVAVSSRLKVDTVAIARRPDPDGGDDLAQARIARERDRAALRFARDRDLGGLEATMARLDAEAAAAVVRPSRTPTAAEARAYLEELPVLWAKTSDAGRHAIAEATFERIDVLGVTDYTFTLTAHAKVRGWDAAFGAGIVRVKEGQSGRGERI